MNPQPTQARAIPLCIPNNFKWNQHTGNLEKTKERRQTLNVNDETLTELGKIKEPVCVVSIVGPCRDGKSFILGETFNQPDVFPVGFKMDPETMGIWIWILPHTIKDNRGRDVRVVLLDSEGTECAEAEGQQDNQIFTLIVLMASVLIYNSKGVPKRNDLNQLEFVLKLSRQIQARSGRQSSLVKNEDAFHKTFPHFIWLLRDVMTDIPDDCKDIKEYFLTRVFKGTEASEKDKTQYIAESILHFFSEFDAFCLPPPAFNKELMKDIKRNKDRMNPEFFSEVEEFKRMLHSKIGPKKSCNEGEYVTGEGLAVLTKLYVDAINDPKSIPNVQTAWETHVQRKCKDAKRKAMQAYDKKIKAQLSKLPCDGEKILASHESAIRQSMAIFNEETVGISSDHTKRDSEELMNEGIQKLAEWKAKNDSRTKESCEKLLKELKGKHLDPVFVRARGPAGTSVSYKEIDDGLAIIELEYKTHTVGAKNVRAQVFCEFHERFKAECDQNKKFLTAMKDYQKELLEQRHKNAEKDKETEKLREEAAYLKKEQKIQEQKLKDLEERKNKELSDKLREYEATTEILNKKIYDMEKAGMEKKISDLETERDEAIEDKLQTECQLHDLQDEITNLKGQLDEVLRLQQLPWWKKLFGMTE